MAPLFHRSSPDAAFERLYRRHVKDVYRYSLAVLGETADAEDVTQATFLNAYRAFQTGERPSKPENWLIAIAHNVCRQRFRQAQRRPQEVEFVDEVAEAPTHEVSDPSPEDLRRALSQLPAIQREALVLRELEGRSYAEIAEILEVSGSALETLLFRARRALREQLEEQLTCEEAAFALSAEEDGRLSSEERRGLRAHLRGCPECATVGKRQRALRGAFKRMLAVPLPASLGVFSGGGASGVGVSGVGLGGAGIAIKAAALLTTGVLATGGAYVGVVAHHRAQHGAPAVTRPGSLHPPLQNRATPAGSVHGKVKAHTPKAKRAHGLHKVKRAHAAKGKNHRSSRAKAGGRHKAPPLRHTTK